jgi:hypothetical protein
MKRLRVTAGYRGQVAQPSMPDRTSETATATSRRYRLSAICHPDNDLFEQVRELSALFQRLMQECAAVFQQALPFFLSQPTGENQPADHARERAGCLLVARPF